MTLDPRRLLVFREVARAGTISGAASVLGWTQPAVSQHLSRLERDAGSPLVERGPRGVRLTEAGRVLLFRADNVAAELHIAGRELSDLADLRVGRVAVACFPSAAATVLPRVLAHLNTTHPGVEVSLLELEPPEAIASVQAGDIDVALIFTYDTAPIRAGNLAWQPHHVEPVALILPPDHSAGWGPAPPVLNDFRAETWIGGCLRCRTHLIGCCRAAGFEPDIRYATDDYVVTQNLVAHGLGVSVLPEMALRGYRNPGVRVVAGLDLGERQIGAVFRSGADLVPATALLLSELRAAWVH